MYNTRRNDNKIKSRCPTNNIANREDSVFETTSLNMTPAQKCLREMQDSAGSPFKMVTILDKRFEKLTIEIHDMMVNKLKEYKDELLSEIDKRFSVLKAEIQEINERVNVLENSTINELKNSIKKLESDNEMKNLKNQVIELKRNLIRQDNSSVAGSLRIRGIPTHSNENLFSVLQNICNNLNVATPQVDSIYRLKKIHNSNIPYTSKDGVIVVKMHSPYQKNFLLKTIAKYIRENKKTLCLRHAGFDSDEPIYVNENLTPHNHRIYQEALRRKREGSIKAAYTMRGLVYIRTNENPEDQKQIYFLEDLQLFRK